MSLPLSPPLRDDTPCSKCGNGVLYGPEPCDDDNTVSGDGCSNECLNE